MRFKIEREAFVKKEAEKKSIAPSAVVVAG